MCWKFDSNLKFLTNVDLWNIKIRQISELQGQVKSWLKFEIFDHAGLWKYNYKKSRYRATYCTAKFLFHQLPTIGTVIVQSLLIIARSMETSDSVNSDSDYAVIVFWLCSHCLVLGDRDSSFAVYLYHHRIHSLDRTAKKSDINLIVLFSIS